jgi:H+/Cl- antiporter ClcA
MAQPSGNDTIAAANRTPLFCALFVLTLQGDPQLLLLLLPLLLASGVSTALAERWRGITWNEAQAQGSLQRSA